MSLIRPTRRELLTKSGELLMGAAALSALPSVVKAAGFGRGGGVAPARSGPAQPAAAALYGFNRLTFFDDFTSINTIDVNNTLQPGFNWYMRNLVQTGGGIVTQNPSTVSVSSSVLTFTPNSSSGGWLGTYGLVGNAGSATNVGSGIAAGGGYFECRIAFSPQSVVNLWPTFWMIDQQVFLNVINSLSFSSNYAEIDFFEYEGGASYTDWDWYSAATQYKNTNTSIAGTPNIADGSYHKIGGLLVPQAKNSGTGLIERYIDGVAYSSSIVNYSATTVSPQAQVGAPTGWMAALDHSTLGFNLQIGSGGGWPINVDYVMVWQ